LSQIQRYVDLRSLSIMTLGAPSMTDEPQTVPTWFRLRRALALPIYTIALILSYASDALGDLAGKIAGDPLP
jgi:hypothetical protein